MNIQLIEGRFNSGDALKMITEIIHVNIRFHENKIKEQVTEKEMKTHINQIQELQKKLFEVGDLIKYGESNLYLKSSIEILST